MDCGNFHKEVFRLIKRIGQVLSYLLVAVLATTVTLATQPRPAKTEQSKLDQLEALIEERFIGDVDATAIEDAAAEAMVDALGDRWSYYIPASEYASYVEQMNNAYVGIGITIQVREDETGFDIIQVNEGGPAEEAGLKPGDVVVAIEGQSCVGMTATQARDLVRGEEETQVQMTILRNGEEMEFWIYRRQVKTIVAKGQMLEDNIGLVTIENFDNRCAQESIAVIEALLEQGAEKIIFDVRNNPGGYAHELVKLLDYLLPEGELFHMEFYTGEEEFDHSDESFLDIPMAVLVNADSFSAAEFFAAALQEYEAGVIVGEKTVGKGYFQTTIQLNDGSAVGLSVGKYYTPGGASLQDVGITPDVEVVVDDETYANIYYGLLEAEQDPQIQAAIQVLK